jgi:hypothetical protein
MRGYGTRFALSVAIGLIGLVGPSSAGAATQIGQTFVPSFDCGTGPGTTYLQTGSPGPSYTVPSRGVLTSWSFQGGSDSPNLGFKVGRAQGGGNFYIVGEGAVQTTVAGQLSTFPIRIPVEAGDAIGILLASDGQCGSEVTPDFTYHYRGGDASPGSTSAFVSDASFQFDVSATLEPDADNDGFGDETQDQCPSSAATQNECVPPETVITKQPKDKTKKKTATFEFSSSEAGSTFQCSLDAGPFAACGSPDTLRVKKGKHHFEVRAIDAAGNVDGSPASDSWKVKKKRKH